MMLNAKLNDTYQRMRWAEAVYAHKLVINSMATTGSTKSPFEKFYGEKMKNIDLLLEFGRAGFVTKRQNVKKQMTDKTFKTIMVGYEENHTRYTYKFCNPEINRVVMNRDVKWED